MRIFLSYASEDRELADQIQLALVAAGRRVFFDRDSLPPGGEYHARIQTALNRSDILVFIITRHSIAPNSYALTELKYARIKWPNPNGRVLPVKADKVVPDMIPAYLKAVSILEPEGNITAEVLAAVSKLESDFNFYARHKSKFLLTGAVIGVVGAIAGVTAYERSKIEPIPVAPPRPEPTPTPKPKPPRKPAALLSCEDYRKTHEDDAACNGNEERGYYWKIVRPRLSNYFQHDVQGVGAQPSCNGGTVDSSGQTARFPAPNAHPRGFLPVFEGYLGRDPFPSFNEKCQFFGSESQGRIQWATEDMSHICGIFKVICAQQPKIE